VKKDRFVSEYFVFQTYVYKELSNSTVNAINYVIGVCAEARRPLWNEIRFCKWAIVISRTFSSVIIADYSECCDGVFIIKNEMLGYVQ
jgi:hypothetical protein